MRRLSLAISFSLGVMVASAWGQTLEIEPIHVRTGTVLTFHLQTRLNPENGNAIDLLPKGTTLNIRVLDSIDSDLTHDGAQFRGVVVSPLVSKDEVVIHEGAEVRGLFALLRSRNHPEGFRYELLITGITDGGRLFQLTASLNPSFSDAAPQETAKANGNNDGAPEKSKPSGSSH